MEEEEEEEEEEQCQKADENLAGNFVSTYDDDVIAREQATFIAVSVLVLVVVVA